MSYKYLLDIALILLSTKLLGLITRRFNLPQVVGALLAGVILGPSFLNILQETDFISRMAELGVIVLMFTAGLESDISQLKSTGKHSFIVALLGVIIPLIGGTAVAYIFNDGSLTTVSELLQNIFIGTILTATSVSITVESLNAGLVLSRNRETPYIVKRFDIVSYMLLSPIFFASIGINMTIPKMSISVIIMTIVLIVIAMITKVIGCGLGAKLCGYSKCEVIQIGIGMISRGEVALIVANKGMKLGIMNSYFLPSVIIMVIITTIVTPILLKKAYKC